MSWSIGFLNPGAFCDLVFKTSNSCNRPQS